MISKELRRKLVSIEVERFMAQMDKFKDDNTFSCMLVVRDRTTNDQHIFHQCSALEFGEMLMELCEDEIEMEAGLIMAANTIYNNRLSNLLKANKKN